MKHFGIKSVLLLLAGLLACLQACNFRQQSPSSPLVSADSRADAVSAAPLNLTASVCGADTSSMLDLQVTCVEQGSQDRRWAFKIVNNGPSPLDIRTANLSLGLWFFESRLRCLAVTGSNGDVFASNGTRVGSLQITGNTYTHDVSTAEFDESPAHKSNQAGSVRLVYLSGQAVIPAGGWVQGFTVLGTSSAACGTSGNWDNFNDDYSGLPNGQSSCGGSPNGPFFDDHHFALFDNGKLVQEAKAGGIPDPATGLPPGAGPCSPTPTKSFTPVPTFTRTPTRTPTSTSTLTATRTFTPLNTSTATRTASSTATSSSTRTATPSVTATATGTSSSTNTSTPTDSATGTPTSTSSPTPSETQTNTLTFTPTASDTPSSTATETATSSATATVPDTPSSTATDTASSTPSATATVVVNSCIGNLSVTAMGPLQSVNGSVYVANLSTNSVQVLNGGAVLLNIPIQAAQIGSLAFTPDGKMLYVVANGIFSGSLNGFAVIDTDPLSPTPNQVTYLRFDTSPIGSVHIDLAGKYAYFNDGCGVELMDIQALSPTFDQVVGTITGFTAGLIPEAAFSPDGKQLWWPEDGGFGFPSLIAVINSDPAGVGFKSKQEITLPNGSNPQGICISADGRRAFVSMWGAGGIKVISTSTLATVTNFTGGTGSAPRGNCLSADGSVLWVVTDGGTYLEKYRVNSVTDTYAFLSELNFDGTSNNVHFVRLSKDGLTAYVPGGNTALLYSADLTANPPTRLPDVSLGGSANYLAVHP